MTTKPLMIAKIKAAGASEVIQHGASWKEADTYLREVILKGDKNGVYVPPFDHPDIWEGHSKLVAEIKQQLSNHHASSSILNDVSNSKPDAIVCSVGGGGLFAGVMQGLDQVGWADIPVLALETKGAESLNAALLADSLVTLPGITSLATSLGATRVAEKAFEYARRPNVRSVVLSDAEATMGCWRLADDERMLVEPACGVNVALCYEHRLEKALGKQLTAESKVVIVLCGGSNVTVDMLAEWRKEYGYIEKKISRNGVVPSSACCSNGVKR
jgi:L-serine/L-threonine ammonia-lyase